MTHAAALRPVLLALPLLVAAAAARKHPPSRAFPPTPALVSARPSAAGIDLRGRLGARRLSMPIQGLPPSALKDTYDEGRSAGRRKHEALDILAPRGTPVHAVDDGFVAKLFLSVPGGITVYQFDPTSTWCYYYAHLDRYAEGLRDGQALKRGDVVGYVGTTGNAPKDTPHLHFAVSRLGPEKRWWVSTPVDPYPILASSS